MDERTVLAVMESFFATRQPPVTMATLAEQPVMALLTDSLNVEEFLLHLELGLQLERAIDVNQLGPSIIDKSFGELAREITRILTVGPAH
jgi:hypothetical protein